MNAKQLLLVGWLISGSGCGVTPVTSPYHEAPLATGFADATAAPLPTDAVVVRDPANDTITQLKGQDLALALRADRVFRRLKASGRYDDLALRFIDAYRAQFRLQDPVSELRKRTADQDTLSVKRVTFAQYFKNVPVWGAGVEAHFDTADQLYLIQGQYVPTPVELTTQPTLTAPEAMSIAAVVAGLETPCERCQSELVFYPGSASVQLAYRIQVGVGLVGFIEGWLVIIDAHSGRVLDKTPSRQLSFPRLRLK